MDDQLLEKVQRFKKRFEKDGFVILGIFGSRARGDDQPESDIDLLFRLEDSFYLNHPLWGGVGRIEEIRAELQASFGFAVDLADLEALRPSAREFILSETIYVA